MSAQPAINEVVRICPAETSGVVSEVPVPASGTVAVSGGTPTTEETSAEINARLIQLVAENPEAGLSELHKRYAGPVNRLVWRLLGPDSEHDDIVQQVFFTMLTGIKKLREPATLDVWVRTVTINAVRQELRRRGVRRLFSSQRPAEIVGDMVREVESRDLLASCASVLNKIPTDQRVVFVLHFAEGHTLREVAKLCDCSLITAKRRLRAADQRFARLVQHSPELQKLLTAAGYKGPNRGRGEDREL